MRYRTRKCEINHETWISKDELRHTWYITVENEMANETGDADEGRESRAILEELHTSVSTKEEVMKLLEEWLG